MEWLDLIYKILLIAGIVCGGIVAFVKWLVNQNKQDDDIATIKQEEKEDIENLTNKHNEDMKAVNAELTIMTYGILACLKGLKEKGCNGPVTKAINDIEKHLNKNAHK